MLDRQGSRFVLEALFLAALAAVLALAKVRPLEIVGVMALGWVVVALLEWIAWRREPHFGSGLPPRYYVPRTTLPPAQPLEQVYAGYPDPQREEAPTWIASAALREQLVADWPHASPGEDDDGDFGDYEEAAAPPVRLPPAPLVAAADPAPAAPAAVPLPQLPAATGESRGSATHRLEPFAPPTRRGLLPRRSSAEVFEVEVPARALPLLLPGQAGE